MPEEMEGEVVDYRYNEMVYPRDGMYEIWDWFHCWKVPFCEVNNRPCLSPSEEASLTLLAYTLTEYEVNRVAKKEYLASF